MDRGSRLTPSVNAELSLTDRLRNDLRQLGAIRRAGSQFEMLFDNIERLDEAAQKWSGRRLAQSRTFEVGFGARPYLLRTLLSLGADAYGVDAEVPYVHGGLAEYRQMLERNGWERAVKTFVRRLLFGSDEEEAFQRELGQRDLRPAPLDSTRLFIGDAAECEPPGRFDFVYSVAVFEHIQTPALEQLVPRMATWIRPEGLALIIPDVYTGFFGGHLPDWASGVPAAGRRSEPWEHLRKRRFPANTTLNELTRADYAELFSASFEILEVLESRRSHLAERHLTPELRAELSMYSEQDLLDENPLFVLKPR